MRHYSLLGRLRRAIVGCSLPTALLFAGLGFSTSAFATISVAISTPSPYNTIVNPGEITAFKITLENDDTAHPVTAVTLTDSLLDAVHSAGFKVAGIGFQSSNYTCTDGTGASVPTTGTVAAALGATSIVLNNATIPVASGGTSGSCEILVEATSTDAGKTIDNTIPINALSGTDNGATITNADPVTQSITVNTLNAPSLGKSFSPSTVIAKDASVTMTLVIDNTRNSVDLPLNKVTDSPAFALRDVFPAELAVAGTPNLQVTCSGAGVPPTVSTSVVGGITTLTAVGGDVAAAGTCTIKIDVVGSPSAGVASKTITNTIHADTGDFGNERGLAASPVSANLTINSDLFVSKHFNATPIAAGQQSSVVITLQNQSPLSGMTLTSMTDSPIDGNGGANMVVNSVATTCTGGTASIAGGTKGVTLTGGTLAAGASCTVTAFFTASLSVAGVPQSFTNDIPIGAATTTDPSIVSPDARDSVTVVDQLLITKTSVPSIVPPGGQVQYTVTVNNFAVAPLTNVIVPDTLPTGMTLIASGPLAPAATGACTSVTNTGTSASPIFNIASVASGGGAAAGVCTLTFWAQAPTTEPFSTLAQQNSIAAHAVTSNGGGGPSNNAGTDPTRAQFTLSANATVAKSFNPNNTSEGSVSLLTITLTNISAFPLINASFTDNLPIGSNGALSQMVIANPSSATSSCGGTLSAPAGGTSITFTGGTIPARPNNGTSNTFGTCTIQVKVVGAAGLYHNTLPLGALTATETWGGGSQNPISSPGPITADITYNPALGASKSFSPTQVASGGKSTVRFNVTNSSTGFLSGVGVHDTLPTGMTIASPSNARTTCAGTADFSHSVTAALPNVFDAQGLTIPPTGNCDVLFDVIATGSSDWVNTVPAGGITAAGGVKTLSPITATLTNKTTGSVSIGVSVANNALLAPGESTLLTIQIDNTGNVDLSNMSLTNYFTTGGLSTGVLNGMQLAPNPAFATTCPGGVVTGGANNASLTLSNASLAGLTNCIITANVTMTTTGAIVDTIPVGAVIDSQSISNTAAVNTSLQAQGNTGITKSFTPAIIKPNDRSRLRLTFINPNAVGLTALTETDNFPNGMTVAPGGGNPSTTCTGAVVVSANSGNAVSVTGGSLPGATGSVPSTCIAEIDVTASTIGAYTNTIAAGDVHGTIGSGPTQNTSPTTAILQVLTPVTIAKSFNAAQVQPGVPSQLSITVTNPNAVILHAAGLTDSLPANVVVAQTPSAGTTCGGNFQPAVSATSVTWTGGTIPASGTCTLTVNVVSNIAGIYTNTIPPGALSTQEGVTNETPATAQLSLLNPPTISKQFLPVSIASGATSTLTLVLGNTNTSADTLSSTLTDNLPVSPGPIVVAATPNIGGTCTTSSVTAAAGSNNITYASGATIPAGGCTITVDVTGTVQGNYNNFIPAGALTTNNGNNPDPANAPLAITPLGSITGRVFQDNNTVPDGKFNNPAGTVPDVGLANVIINLTGHSNGPDGLPNTGDDIANFTASTITDALGNYSFTGLFSGTYTVTEPNQPVGTLNGITSATTAGTSVTPTTTVPSVVSNIALTGTTTVTSSTNNNFAEVVPSSIAGNVFLDQNSNGTRELSDLPLAGITVQLINTTTNAVLTTQTDATGAYSFTNVPPGNYTLKEPTQPPNTINGITTAGSTANGGTAGTGSPATTAISTITGIILPPGIASTGNNFAELASGRQISGQVYMDANNNGVVDGGEVGIAGVTLTLTGTDLNGNPVPANTTTVTDANGRYIFMGLAEGTYTVTEPTQPPRSTNGITSAGPAGGTATNVATVPSVISAIPLTGTTTVAINNNFGEIPILTGTVSGKVYVDTNNNGIVDAGETGISGVTVTLSGTEADGTTPFTQTVTTAGDGSYAFTNVPPSNGAGYSISELQPSLNTDGKTTVAAGNPGVASSTKPVTGNNLDIIRGVTVLAGDVLPNYNFGEGNGLGLGLIPPIVNGYVYLDKNHDRTRDNSGTDPGESGWTVTLTQNGTLICTTTTDSSGFYQFDNLHCAGYQAGLPTGSGFAIAFTKNGNHLPEVPQSGGNAGTPVAANGTITGITLHPSDQVVEQNLPLDPSGVVYDSSSRAPVAGAVVTITGPAGFDPTTMLTTGSATQTTGTDGLYAFFLQNAYPSGVYTLSVLAPAGYQPAPSTILPACIGTAVIGALPTPARIQASDTAPPQSVTVANPAACVGAVGTGATTTQYYFSFNITNGTSAPILNNHIPLDPMSAGQILVTKTTPLVNVSPGDMVPYTITATNTLANPIANVAVRDVVPPGFKYRAGSGSLNGVPLEPSVAGRTLTWAAQTFAAKEKKVYRLILVVGAGVNTGKYVNQGWAMDAGSAFTLSNMATATVNVVPDPTFDCPDVIGKVFDDKNANGYQDQGEGGIPGVRIATVTGLLVTTDSEGRFHVPCPEIPDPERGSNYVMKLDVRTLPSGYRITTENPRDIRLTRGKVSKLNFGATVHRVVRLELSDAAFQPNTDTLLPTWQKQLDALPETLKLRPSVVRLNYQNGNDSPDLVKKRIATISKQIKGRWTALKGQYTLNIETEDAQ